MDYDLLVRRGRVVDGSGLPSFIADVGVKDGKVAEVGKLKGTAARTIDADGLAVTPGFIDHHTHLDAQMLWDPYGTCEPQHGITSVVMGNCGLTLAPVKNGDEDALVKSFVRVEAIPRFALEQGVKWGWHSYGEYLDNLEGKVGINVGGLVGHIAVRHNVMGEEAVERKATGREVQQMRGARAGGAWKAARWESRRIATSATCARTASRSPADWPTTKSCSRSATCWRAQRRRDRDDPGPQQDRAL